MKDVQRDFYETGYGGPTVAAEAIAAGFARQSTDSRISRAAALLRGVSGHLLDVGCGSGPLLHAAQNDFEKLSGVDIAEAQLARARVWSAQAKIPLHLYRCNLDVESLPLPDGSVDAVTCMVVLEFVFSPDVVVSEIARVLRPGGMLVCSTGNIVSWKNRLRVLMGRNPQTTTFRGAINGGALHHFTQATFIELLARFGLKVEHVTCSGRWWRVRQFWPALLAGDILLRARKPELSSATGA